MCRHLQQQSPQGTNYWTFEVNPRQILGTMRMPKVRNRKKEKGEEEGQRKDKDVQGQ
jgi:hypothetical protein